MVTKTTVKYNEKPYGLSVSLSKGHFATYTDSYKHKASRTGQVGQAPA